MGRRIVAPASAIVEALTPSTWSVAIGRPRVGAKSCATTQCSGPPSGRNPISDTASSPFTATTPPVTNTSTGTGARAFRAEASETGTPMTKSRSKVSSASAARVARCNGASSPPERCAKTCGPRRSVSASRVNPASSRTPRTCLAVSGSWKNRTASIVPDTPLPQWLNARRRATAGCRSCRSRSSAPGAHAPACFEAHHEWKDHRCRHTVLWTRAPPAPHEGRIMPAFATRIPPPCTRPPAAGASSTRSGAT